MIKEFKFTKEDILEFIDTIEDEALERFNVTNINEIDWSKVDINIQVNNNHIVVPGNADTYEMLGQFLLDCKEVLVDVTNEEDKEVAVKEEKTEVKDMSENKKTKLNYKIVNTICGRTTYDEVFHNIIRLLSNNWNGWGCMDSLSFVSDKAKKANESLMKIPNHKEIIFLSIADDVDDSFGDKVVWGESFSEIFHDDDDDNTKYYMITFTEDAYLAEIEVVNETMEEKISSLPLFH